MPLAIPSSGIRRTADDLATATRAAIELAPSGRDSEALAAFVFAWHHHWPDSFAASFADAVEVIDWAARHAIDDNRYLKLRRIALENLAHVL